MACVSIIMFAQSKEAHIEELVTQDQIKDERMEEKERENNQIQVQW